jgi:hypothetical protein
VVGGGGGLVTGGAVVTGGVGSLGVVVGVAMVPGDWMGGGTVVVVVEEVDVEVRLVALVGAGTSVRLDFTAFVAVEPQAARSTKGRVALATANLATRRLFMGTAKLPLTVD